MNEFNEERETEPFVKQEDDDDESLGSNDVVPRQNSVRPRNQQFLQLPQPVHLLRLFPMFCFLLTWLRAILRLFRSRRELLVENLALRQQLIVFKRRNQRPKLSALDKLFWVLAPRFWSDWKESLLVVAPETVVRWHRAGFRLYWSMISKIRKRVGRSRISREVRDLIFPMVAENPTWGAPRIHGDLRLTA